MKHDLYYSELLHNSATKWGLTEIPGRPLIGLPPSSTRDGISGNPYLEEPIPTHETITCGQSSIRLFEFNGFWGYSLDVKQKHGSYGYASYLKFCEPFPSKKTALINAISQIASDADPDEDKDLIKWTKSLLQPIQLTLF
ncbi:MAG: hypothetical protein IAF02_19925 [Anaerolineae bacterium]|nr:hypothetical protein [Anaerolineae bacterium]